MDKIPHRVNQITELYDLENYSTELKQRRKKVCGFRDLGCQIKWQIQSRVNGHKYPNYGENKWAIWGKNLPSLGKHYDLAISYMNGFPNYYVIDKVNADKKVLWIHNEFEKMGYDYDFEAAYYKKADKIVTISQACVDSFARVYPELRNKVVVLENISSANDIFEKAKEVPETDAFFNFEGRRIVSVGRLSEQKNFQLAVQAAQKLKSYGVNFIWYILGEGELRQNLTEKIKEYDLTDQVKLVGIKPNPYPYIANCDVFVQSSIYEGKSIVLDTARVLGAENIGIYSYTYAIVSSVVMFGALGTATYGQKEIASAGENIVERSEKFLEIWVLKAVTMVIAFLIFVPYAYQTTAWIYYALQIPYIVAGVFDISFFFQGIEKFRYIAVRNTIVRIAGIQEYI